MKLIKEYISPEELQILKEDHVDESGNKVRTYRIKGIVMQDSVKNKNGRIYKKALIEREVNRYREECMKTNRALGELDHPNSPSVNLERVSHIIENLENDNSNWVGTARLIDTPNGRIAITLVKEGVKLGASSRGVGSLTGEYVNDDYKLMVPFDLVHNASAPDAYVQGVLENKEYIISGDEIIEVAVKSLQEHVDKKYDSILATQYIVEFIKAINRKL